MDTVLLVIHLLVAVALIFVVLMQRTAQDGGGLMGGGGTMGGLFTSRGSANLLTRTTAILATAFIALSLILGVMAAQKHKGSLVDQLVKEAVDQTNTPEAPAPADAAPKAEEKAPAEPQVPVSK